MSSSIERSDHSFAVVTPTYLPDLRRCELLAESLDRCAPHVPHYLIVDRRDRSAFSHLERGRRCLIELRGACRELDVADARPQRPLA